MNDGAQRVRDDQVEERGPRNAMRWLVWGSVVALVALITWAILAAANGSPAGMVAASSGAVAVAVAWSSGYTAIKARRQKGASSD